MKRLTLLLALCATALAETIAQGCTAKQIASAKRNAVKLARK